MALIYFYDSSELDVSQLSAGLLSTDHRWEYNAESISLANLDPASEVISVFVTSVVSREIIASLPNLKLIACRSTGFNNVDLAAARDFNVTVVNVPTYGEATVAEYAFTLLLALARKLPESLDFLNNNSDVRKLTGWDLSGKTIGVVGSGRIGQHVIKIAKGFEMRAVAYDPFSNYDAAKKLGFEYLPLDELLKISDVVSLHAPYVPANHHLINAEKLALMKPTAAIVNTARGELIDTKALVGALKDKRIAGAALDVLEGEILMNLDEEVALLRSQHMPRNTVENSMSIIALNKMDNVILTPHNAFNTTEAIGRINSITTENIIRFWYGDVPNKVELRNSSLGTLFLSRHSESEWNVRGRWTGRANVNLSEKGFREATLLGFELQKFDTQIDQAFCSEQIRTLETMEGILNAAQQFGVPFKRTAAINERDYGKYTAKNKWEMQEMLGDKEFNGMRRGWDHPVPNGETLKMVYERVVPFYQAEVLPILKAGKNVLIVAHGNSLRALIKYLESISDTAVEDLEMLFGSMVAYTIGEDGLMIEKVERQIDSPRPDA